MKDSNLIFYFAKNIYIVVGLVMVWRGIWYILDAIDKWLFGYSNIISVIITIILGLALLYVPDKDLKEIQKL